MSSRMVLLYFGMVIYGKWLYQPALCYDPNIRYHSPIISPNMPRLNYSYVNLKKVPGHHLSVVPFSTMTVRNLTNCYSECLKSNGSCKSMNVMNSLESPGMLNCSLLDTDIFQYPNKFVEKTDSTHFAIMVCNF